MAVGERDKQNVQPEQAPPNNIGLWLHQQRIADTIRRPGLLSIRMYGIDESNRPLLKMVPELDRQETEVDV